MHPTNQPMLSASAGKKGKKEKAPAKQAEVTVEEPTDAGEGQTAEEREEMEQEEAGELYETCHLSAYTGQALICRKQTQERVRLLLGELGWRWIRAGMPRL